MKNLKWARADVKRAEKMGFWLETWTPRASDGEPFTYYGIGAYTEERRTGHVTRFRSDREAAEWVCNNAAFGLDMPPLKQLPKHKADSWRNAVTCRKAILLCCRGGQTK